jgi:hypothetical protein
MNADSLPASYSAMKPQATISLILSELLISFIINIHLQAMDWFSQGYIFKPENETKHRYLFSVTRCALIFSPNQHLFHTFTFYFPLYLSPSFLYFRAFLHVSPPLFKFSPKWHWRIRVYPRVFFYISFFKTMDLCAFLSAINRWSRRTAITW